MKSQNLKIENVKTSDLIPYVGNAKLHPEKQIGQIASSIKEFGFVVPVLLDEDNGIIAGHGRVEAAKKLKMKTVPCVRIGDLTPAQVRGLRVAENQLTMSSGWDYEILGLELDGLKELDFDLDVLGFEDLDFMLPEPGEPADAEPQIDQAEELNKKWGVVPGELWEIGEHRLLCGDSTKAEDVARVMGGEKADMVMADPPYGMDLDTDYSGMKGWHTGKKYALVIGDDKPFDYRWFDWIDCDEQFWWGADYYVETLPDFGKSGSWFVWDKRVDESKDKMFGSGFEMLWSKIKHQRRLIRSMWAGFMGDAEASNRLHPTQKPTRLFAEIITEYGGDNIFDPFLGSGTTLIAAENLKRCCFGIEISENYCAVILERMSTAFPKLTIQKATQ